jgi:hypothetical protein
MMCFLLSQVVFAKTFEDLHLPKSAPVSEKICLEVLKQMNLSSFKLKQNKIVLEKLEREALKNDQLILEQETTLENLEELQLKLTTYHQRFCRK